MERAVILDLDNVFFNSSCLEKYLPKNKDNVEEWDEIAKYYKDCSPNSWCIDFVLKYVSTHTIFFITSREDKGDTRYITTKSITEALGLNFDRRIKLLMRDGGNMDDSHVVKRNLYKKHIKGQFKVDICIDDELKNAEVWKEENITSLLNLI